MERVFTEDYVDTRAGNIRDLGDKEFQELLDTVLYEKARRDMRGARTHGITIQYELIFEGHAAFTPRSEVKPTLIRMKKQAQDEYFNLHEPF
jgi:hypothetical protein